MINGTRVLLAGVAGIALVIGSAAQAQSSQQERGASPVDAQAGAGERSIDTGEIVVTAQKREQRLIDVPVAITAIGSTALTSQGLTRITDFYDRVPSLQYGGQRVTNLAIRGITTGGATNPTVAILVDDVQFGSTTSSGQPSLPDFDASVTDRIEVLRGPQGTLYGAASLGGLIKYVLKQPDTKSFSGRIEASGQSVAHGNEGYGVRGTVNVPITDWLAVLGSGFKRDDPAYLDNLRTGAKDTNTRNVWGFRGAVLLKPFDALTITGSALLQKQHAINSDSSVPVCVACTTGGTAATRATAVTTFEPVYGDLTLNVLDQPLKSKFALYTGRAVLNLGAATITSISAWSQADFSVYQDVTAVFTFLPAIYASPGANVQIANIDHTTKFSQELRANGTLGKFDWLVGGFYTTEHANTNQTLFLSGGNANLNLVPYDAGTPSRYREIAAFGDLTWHVADKFDLQIGGRYAENKQRSDIDTVVDTRAQVAFGGNTAYVSRANDKVFTWLVSPTYHVNRDIIVFARVASGYRPGGPNLASTGVPAYKSDSVINYELGFKGRVIPGLLTIDSSLFQIDWKDIQLQGTASNNFGFVTNGGKARSRGVEFAANLTPWHGASFDGNMTFTDAVVTQSLPQANSSSINAAKGDRLPFSARFATSLTALQRFDLATSLAGNFSVNFTHVGKRYSAFNTFAGTRPRLLIPGYDTINLSAGLTYDRVWELTAALRNATDKRGIRSADNRNGVNVPLANFIQPRTVILTLARSF